MHLFVVAGFAPSLINFRRQLLQLFVARSHTVTALAPSIASIENVRAELQKDLIQLRSIPLSRNTLSPITDIRLILSLLLLSLRYKPDHLFAYTVKPIIYTGFAVRIIRCLSPNTNISFTALVTGLGYAFTDESHSTNYFRYILKRILLCVYSISLKEADVVFFQNPDDLRFFSDLGLIRGRTRSVRLWGSGVDLDTYQQQPVANSQTFLMLSRLIVEKGVCEYVQAARLVKTIYPDVVFNLAGSLEFGFNGIPRDQIDSWNDEGVINYLGNLNSVHSALRDCRYFVLPTYYREGIPRSILEALATGRPVITTNTPGCRDTVVEGVNGFLVDPRDPHVLADAMMRMINLSETDTQHMAAASCDLARNRFDVHKVNQSIIESMGL